MNQPPNPVDAVLPVAASDGPSSISGDNSTTPPDWRRGAGIAPGTWDYVHRPSIADGYDEFISDTPLCRWDQNRLTETFPDQSECENESWIADFGCGSGRASLELAGLGYRVLAIDLSQSMLLRLAEKRPPHDDRIHPLRMNLVELGGLADRSLDHGVCLFATLGMIQGRQHRRAFLGHVARLLRPGGSFMVHVHHRWAGLTERGGWRRLATAAIRRDQELGDSVYGYRGIGDMFMHRYGKRELIGDLKAAGFASVAITRVNRTGDGEAKSIELAGGFLATAWS